MKNYVNYITSLIHFYKMSRELVIKTLRIFKIFGWDTRNPPCWEVCLLKFAHLWELHYEYIWINI